MEDASTTPTPTLNDSVFPSWLGLLIIAILGVVVLPLAQAQFGLWEPWETTWAEVARAMRESGEWFNPQLGGKSAPWPLLPVWLIAAAQAVGDGSEWLMRWPMALCVTLGSSAIFLWLREPFGGRRGLIAALATLTSLQVVLSTITLAGNGVFVGILMAIVAVYGLLLGRRPDKRPLWLQLTLAALLALGVLAWGLWGFLLPVLIGVALGITQLAQGDSGAKISTQTMVITGVVVLCTVGGLVGWGLWQWNLKGWQILMVSLPVVVILGGVVIARDTQALRATGTFGGAMCLALPLTVACILAILYDGNASDKGFAAFELLMENHLTRPNALPQHVTFDFWVRQVGFAAFPWTLLGPFALVLMVRPDETGDTEIAAPFDPTLRAMATLDNGRLLGLWFILSALAMGLLGTLHEHYLFPGIPALAVAGALMLTDDTLWERLRRRPVMVRVMGLAMILMILFLCKDLERYPKELLGPLLTDGKLDLPESFSYGSSLKIIRYTLIALVVVFMFNPLSTAVRWFRRLVRKESFEAQLSRARQALGVSETSDLGAPSSVIEHELRMKGAGPLRTLVRWCETPRYFAVLFLVAALSFTALMGFRWVPALSDHLTLKGLLDHYGEVAKEGESLRTYQMGTPNTSYYLSGYESSTLTTLKQQFRSDERFFLVLPNDRLGSLSYEIRKAEKPRRSVHVVNDRSSRFLLASNKLLEGEEELSPIANAILATRPKPIMQTVFEDPKKQRQYPQFDKKIQLLGVEVYHTDEVDRWGTPSPEAVAKLKAIKGEGKLPVFKLGETMVMRYYFKVLKRTTSSQKIFLHVDYPGNRINGDHVPVDGAFGTNHWIPGDYVVDTQRLLIDYGSNQGKYTMYMGFFLGNNRMKVTPRSAHDGQNRVNLGQIEVIGF